MPKIEDYALIGDMEAAALVGRDGSIDWLCVPRFDSPACFAALLGTRDNGYWRLAPAAGGTGNRHYRPDSLVLETRFEADGGAVTVIDCMPVRAGDTRTRVARLVRGESGSVRMRMELSMRFDYGLSVPWVRRTAKGLEAISGENALLLETPVPLVNKDFITSAEFTVAAGDTVSFLLTYHSSLIAPDPSDDIPALIDSTEAWWLKWIERYPDKSRYRDAVVRSLITLKALTHAPTGGLVAAPTTSLPETIGGQRNWDYRFCWLRDATFTLYSLLLCGMSDEAKAWRDWVLRVGAGSPDQLQTIYGPMGQRLLPEFELGWLSGYESSLPVRAGNEAHTQLQLDIYGELMDMFHLARRAGIKETADSWALQVALLDFLESGWKSPDNGIWEVRGRRADFTHSKVMVWVALDRAVRAAEAGLDGPVDRWKALRERVHADVCEKGFNTERNSFVQTYGSNKLDGALLMIPLVGFLPASDPRVLGTVASVETELVRDGFVLRYVPDQELEGVEGQEGAFLPCTFWLADCYALIGRDEDARRLFDRLLDIRNDVGLLSEEYDPRRKRLIGNFPQAFTHVSLINTAHNVTTEGPAHHRSGGTKEGASGMKLASDAP